MTEHDTSKSTLRWTRTQVWVSVIVAGIGFASGDVITRVTSSTNTTTTVVTRTVIQPRGGGAPGAVAPGTVSLSSYAKTTTFPTDQEVTVDPNRTTGQVGSHKFSSAVTANIYDAATDPAQAELQIPVAGFKHFMAKAGIAYGSDINKRMTLEIYADRVAPPSTLWGPAEFDGPSTERDIDIALAGVTTLVLVWRTVAGQSALPNGTDFILGDGVLAR